MSRRLGLAAACALLVAVMIPAPFAVGQATMQVGDEPEYRPSNELRLELFELFDPDGDPDRDTRNVPDREFPAWSPGDETFTAEAVLRHSAAPDLELTVTVEHNADTGYTRSSANAQDLAVMADLYNSEVDEDEPDIEELDDAEVATDPSLVFEAVDHGGTHLWARGLPVELVDGDERPSPTRWYSGRRGSDMIAVVPALSSVDQLWAEDLKRLPAFDESTDEDGTVIRRSVGGAGTDVARVFGSLLFYPRDDAEQVAVTTSSTAAGILESVTLDVDLHNGDQLTFSIRFVDRGELIEHVEIGDIYRMPDADIGNDIPAEDYDWTATGASFGPSGESLHDPWTVHGQVRHSDTRRTSLSIAASDLAILAGESISVAADHEIVRYEYGSRSYISGLTAEFVPQLPSTVDDPNAIYIYDLLSAPTHLFPMGLSDEEVWVRLGTVPELTSLTGWNNDRVTTSRIPLRVVGYDGFMEWIGSESPDEIFTVTVGSTDAGRVERVLVGTLDPDGSRLAFDIVIEPQPDGLIDLPAQTATHLRESLSPLTIEDEGRLAFDSTQFDGFFEDTRLEYPTVTARRVPRYLTVIAEPVDRAEVSRTEISAWPNKKLVATGAWSVPGTELIVGCLSTIDTDGRAELTQIWDMFEDGSSLDDRMVRIGRDQYSRVTLYATDEYALRGPCRWEPQPFG